MGGCEFALPYVQTSLLTSVAKAHQLRLQMAAYQALKVYDDVNLARSHCFVVDLVHRPQRRRGSSSFDVHGWMLYPLLAVHRGLLDEQKRRFDEQLRWIWEAPVQGQPTRTLTIVRFWTPHGFIGEVAFAPGNFLRKDWPAIRDWIRFLS